MSKESRHLKHSNWEYVLPALAIASLVISCVLVSSKKFFWSDEFYSYHFTSDPSFTSMLAAFHDKINNTPLLYFLLGWIWDKAFGSSELSLRLFSSLGMCGALAVTWVVIRRHFGLWATTIGVLGIFCTSEVILSQNTEARMYGLYLALCALALLLYDNFYREDKTSAKLLVLNTVVHIAIVHTHLFGGFYSGAMLLSMLVSDSLISKFRPKVYLTFILSWLSVVFYIPSFLNQADAGKPRTWIPEPVVRDLLDVFNFQASPFMHQSLLVLLLLFSAFHFYGREAVPSTEHKSVAPARLRWHLVVYALSFIVLPLFVWLISKTIKPIFWDRYMVPSALGWVIVLAYFSSRIFSVPVSRSQQQVQVRKLWHFSAPVLLYSALGIILLFCLSRPILFATAFHEEVRPGSDDATGSYPDLPVVMQYSGEFLERIHYAPDPEKYYFILDWETAVNEHSGLFTPQEHKHMEAFKRNYPQLYQDNILTTEEFLSRFDRFLVFDHPEYDKKCPLNPEGLKAAHEWEPIHCPQWVEMRLLNNNAYKVTYLEDDSWFTMLLVEKQKNL